MSYEQRRRHPRQTRRVQVRYRVEGEERLRRGFTKNISLSGALVTGNDLPGRGALLRMELVSKGVERVVYARVVHAHQVPVELRRFAESAMGVRFLHRRELVAPFLGAAESAPGSSAAETSSSGSSASGTAGGSARSGGELSRGSWPISGGHAAGASEAEGDGDGAAAGRSAKKDGDAAGEQSAKKGPVGRPKLDAGRTYELRYETPKDFLAAYRRDLVNGGLFVATADPASLYDTVTVQLHLPPPVRQVFRFEARVVQSVEPRQLPDGATGGGVGLEVLDTDRVLKDLKPVVDLLR